MNRTFTIVIVLNLLTIQMLFSQNKNTAELLGYDSQARLLIINADDFAMSHAENAATMDLLLGGHISSATIMVPCPWFPEVARFCKENPQVDVGLHLTLTSEWENYKWGSVSSANLVPSLLTPEGYFHNSEFTVELWSRPEEVEIELRAQIERAINAGIQPSHIDNHMGSVYGLYTGRDFLDVVFRLSAEYGLPFRLPRNISDYYAQRLPEERINKLETLARDKVAQGFALPDYLTSTSHGDTFEETFNLCRQLLQSLKPGVTELYLHAAMPTDEIKAITNAWIRRDYDYRLFKSDKMKSLLDSLGIIVIGWKDLQALQLEQLQTGIATTNTSATSAASGLQQNYPNPFNSATTISYSLPHQTDIVLKIYNTIGELVRTIIVGTQGPGLHKVQWDGNDRFGQPVTSGIYLYRIEGDGVSQTGKMMLVE